MRRILLASAMLVCMSAPSWAVCAVTNLTVKDAAASPVTVLAPWADDGSGGSNCEPQVMLKQGGNVVNVTAGNALKVDGSAVTQPTSLATLPALPTGANTIGAVNQASAPWTVNPGTLGTWGLAASTQNVATPTNGMLSLGEFNTTPAPITSGNSSPMQLDLNGNLKVNVIAGGGTGGTSSNFSTAFPTLGTAIGVQSGVNMIAWPAKAANTTSNTDVVPEVAVANSTTPGSATAGNSSPVVNAQNTPQILNGLTNTKTQIKGSAGQLTLLQCGNTNASQVYVQVFNQASSAVTVGTTTPTMSIPIAATSTGGFALPGGLQMNGATPGITVAATTTATGSTAPGTALDCNAGYM